MNKLRCFLFAAIVVLATATFAMGGIIQTPGKSDPPPPQPAPTSASDPNTDGMIATSIEGQIMGHDLATAALRELLLTIY